MSTPFLRGFATSIVDALLSEDALVVTEGKELAVVEHVAKKLASAKNQSLISSLSAALLDAPDVDELYADDKQIKLLVESLGRHGG